MASPRNRWEEFDCTDDPIRFSDFEDADRHRPSGLPFGGNHFMGEG